jgi:trans-2-enoyl-CoA reductase
MKHLKRFEDVYYEKTPNYETKEEREKKLLKFAEEFADEQIGLEILDVNVYEGRINIHYKKNEGPGRNNKEISEETKQHIKDDWRLMAEDLIEELEREEIDYPGYYVNTVSINGFEIRCDNFKKKISSYSPGSVIG